MKWQKGQSGNPSGVGRPRMVTQQIISALNEIVPGEDDNPSKLRKVVDQLITKAMEGDIQAIREVIDRVEGKPPQFSTSDAEAFRRATDMSDDELASIASGSSEGTPAKTNGSALTH